MSMPSLQRLFGLNTQKTKQKKTIAERPPEILSEKFETFKTILFSLASETGRMRAVSAISLFVDLMGEYADPSFMRALKEELTACGAVDFTALTKEPAEKEQNVASADADVAVAPKPISEKLIKPAIL